MQQLIPCRSCRRHVFSTERRCPFCGRPGAPAAPAARVCATAGILTLATLGVGWDASASPAEAGVDAYDPCDAGREDASFESHDGDRFVHPMYGMPAPRNGCL